MDYGGNLKSGVSAQRGGYHGLERQVLCFKFSLAVPSFSSLESRL